MAIDIIEDTGLEGFFRIIMYSKRILDIIREKHTMNLQCNINKFKPVMKINKLSGHNNFPVSNDHLSSCLQDIAENQSKESFKIIFNYLQKKH